MEELKLFQSPIFGQVRTVVVNGQVMFAATDVARCLGYTNPQKAIRVHCKSAGVNEMDTPTNGAFFYTHKIRINISPIFTAKVTVT